MSSNREIARKVAKLVHPTFKKNGWHYWTTPRGADSANKFEIENMIDHSLDGLDEMSCADCDYLEINCGRIVVTWAEDPDDAGFFKRRVMLLLHEDYPE